jgi:hypothetical protein
LTRPGDDPVRRRRGKKKRKFLSPLELARPDIRAPSYSTLSRARGAERSRRLCLGDAGYGGGLSKQGAGGGDVNVLEGGDDPDGQVDHRLIRKTREPVALWHISVWSPLPWVHDTSPALCARMRRQMATSVPHRGSQRAWRRPNLCAARCASGHRPRGAACITPPVGPQSAWNIGRASTICQASPSRPESMRSMPDRAERNGCAPRRGLDRGGDDGEPGVAGYVCTRPGPTGAVMAPLPGPNRRAPSASTRTWEQLASTSPLTTSPSSTTHQRACRSKESATRKPCRR